MATFNWSIKSSGGDYTSLSAAEAAITDGNTYNISYDEALSDTTPCSFAGAYTSSVVNVTVAAAFRSYGAVSGSHAELNYGTNDATDLLAYNIGMNGVTFSYLRFVRTGSTNASADAYDNIASGNGPTFKYCTFVRKDSGATGGRAIRAAGPANFYHCFVVDEGRNASNIDVCFFSSTSKVYRLCVFLASGTAQSCIHNSGAGAAVDARQVLALKAAGATCSTIWKATTGSFSANCDANGSSDATTPGSNANNSLSPGNVFTTLTVGSENLHYPSNAAMVALTAGSDLSGTVGATDIDGHTITAWYPGSDFIAAAPTVSSVSPGAGGTAGGLSVTITGTNFTDATSVTFGGSAATSVVVQNATTITCVTPAHSAGAVSVLVTTPGGTNAANSAFTYTSNAGRGPLRLGMGLKGDGS